MTPSRTGILLLYTFGWGVGGTGRGALQGIHAGRAIVTVNPKP